MLHGDPLLSRKSEYSVSLIIHLVQRLPSAEQGGGSGEDEGGGECCKSLLRLLHSPQFRGFLVQSKEVDQERLKEEENVAKVF